MWTSEHHTTCTYSYQNSMWIFQVVLSILLFLHYIIYIYPFLKYYMFLFIYFFVNISYHFVNTHLLRNFITVSLFSLYLEETFLLMKTFIDIFLHNNIFLSISQNCSNCLHFRLVYSVHINIFKKELTLSLIRQFCSRRL